MQATDFYDCNMIHFFEVLKGANFVKHHLHIMRSSTTKHTQKIPFQKSTQSRPLPRQLGPNTTPNPKHPPPPHATFFIYVANKPWQKQPWQRWKYHLTPTGHCLCRLVKNTS